MLTDGCRASYPLMVFSNDRYVHTFYTDAALGVRYRRLRDALLAQDLCALYFKCRKPSTAVANGKGEVSPGYCCVKLRLSMPRNT
jgi:hypothetical protein